MTRTGGRAATGRQADRPTGRQARILRFVEQPVKQRGFPPSMRESGEAVGLNSAPRSRTRSWRWRGRATRPGVGPTVMRTYRPERPLS
ncbi:hypothetical protein [Kitasatospora herbaricolor]|uniref:LexA family protein n=1 Tax=Kitasatospora herbaricolor TaxID=68217 RepID=UPI0039A74DE8